MKQSERFCKALRRFKPGDLVDYVYVDNGQINALKRIAPSGLAESYDADKYAEMLLDVTESILAVFGFSRTQLGFERKPRSFLEEPRGERGREILLELENLDLFIRLRVPGRFSIRAITSSRYIFGNEIFLCSFSVGFPH